MSDMVEQHPEGQEGATGHRLAEYSVVFAIGFLFWLLIVWPVAPSGGRPLWGDMAAGLAVAGIVALVSRRIVTQRFGRLLQPARYFWAVIYLFVFAYYVIRANVDVAYRVLSPAMPIRPGIVRARSRLRTASARTALANCITLTPGTLTIDIAEDGMFYIHWINVQTVDEEVMARQILGRFEWFIARIFE
jgi:multicomponent Na+:H+ antiporter subunit E